MTIGSGIRFTFDRVSYTDVALESGKVYRVFIRLYSGADTPVREREGRRGRGGEKEKGSEREGGMEGGREGERERREGGRKRGGGREGIKLEGEQTVHMYILLKHWGEGERG